MKIKIEELGCFNEVASVIGVTEAKRELFIAVNSKDTLINNSDWPLGCAFRWQTTPQGAGFWWNIEDGINPKANP